MKKSSRILPYILWRVLPMSLLILLLIWLGLRFMAQSALQQEVDERLEAQVSYIADGVSRSLQTLIESSKGVASNTIVINGLIESTDEANYLLAFFESLKLPGPESVQITMIDSQGLVIVSNQEGRSYEGALWLDQITAGEAVLQLSNRKLLMAEPIMSDELPEGALVVEYGTQELDEIFGIQPNTGAFAIINDTTGNVIFSSDSTLAQRGGPAPDFEGDRWLHFKEPIPDFPDLRLISAERRENVFAPIRQLDQLLFFTMGLNLLALVGGVGLSVHLVTNPLSTFVQKVRTIRGADDLQKVTVSGSAEFQEMAQSFNQMIEDLQNTSVSRDYVDNIIKSMSDTLIVLGSDQSIQTVNPATCALLGYQEEELIGQSLALILGEKKFKKKAEVFAAQNVEINYLSKDGKEIPMLFSASVMHDTEQQVQGIVCVAQDITALQEARKLLRENEIKYRTLFENSKDAIFIHTLTGKFVDVNQAMQDLFGYPRAEMMRMNAPKLYLNPTSASKFQLQMLQKGSVRDFEVKVHKKDRTEIDCLITATVRKGDNGKVLSYQGIIHDITERKKAERVLAEYNQKLEQEVAQRTTELAKANQEITELSKRLKVENLRLGAELDVTRQQEQRLTSPQPIPRDPTRDAWVAPPHEVLMDQLSAQGVDDVTRQLQQILLPTPNEVRLIKGLDIAAVSSDQFDGDDYDLLLQHTQVQIGIGNLNGGGLQNSILMLMTVSAVRTLLTSSEKEQSRFLDLIRINIESSVKSTSNTPQPHNPPFSLALLDYQVGRFSSSGQRQKIIVVYQGGQPALVDSYDLGFPKASDSDPLQVRPIEGVILYTTQITGEDYGLEQFSDLITRHWQKPAQAITAALIKELRRAKGRTSQKTPHDFNLLVLKQK